MVIVIGKPVLVRTRFCAGGHAECTGGARMGVAAGSWDCGSSVWTRIRVWVPQWSLPVEVGNWRMRTKRPAGWSDKMLSTVEVGRLDFGCICHAYSMIAFARREQLVNRIHSVLARVYSQIGQFRFLLCLLALICTDEHGGLCLYRRIGWLSCWLIFLAVVEESLTFFRRPGYLLSLFFVRKSKQYAAEWNRSMWNVVTDR